jgi:hypothetical protein
MLYSPGVNCVKTLVYLKYGLRNVCGVVMDRNRESWQENETRFTRPMARKFEVDNEVYFTYFRVFMASVVPVEVARFSETSEGIIIHGRSFFFSKKVGKCQ